MNFWTPTNEWSALINESDTSMPWYAEYDWVEVHSYDPDTKEFMFEWHDDFDWLDESRWTPSDNKTFDGNTSKFMRSQTYTESGKLVLKMEKPIV